MQLPCTHKKTGPLGVAARVGVQLRGAVRKLFFARLIHDLRRKFAEHAKLIDREKILLMHSYDFFVPKTRFFRNPAKLFFRHFQQKGRRCLTDVFWCRDIH
jgi:hypothetical protein